MHITNIMKSMLYHPVSKQADVCLGDQGTTATHEY